MFNDAMLAGLTTDLNENFSNLAKYVDLENPVTREAMETMIGRWIQKRGHVSDIAIANRFAKVYIFDDIFGEL